MRYGVPWILVVAEWLILSNSLSFSVLAGPSLNRFTKSRQVCFLAHLGLLFSPSFTHERWFGKALPKSERLKLAARRLSNIAQLGEAGVRRLERKLENSSSRRGVVMNDDHSASAPSLDYHPSTTSSDCHNPSKRKMSAKIFGESPGDTLGASALEALQERQADPATTAESRFKTPRDEHGHEIADSDDGLAPHIAQITCHSGARGKRAR
jgi:hypothetical protein